MVGRASEVKRGIERERERETVPEGIWDEPTSRVCVCECACVSCL